MVEHGCIGEEVDGAEGEAVAGVGEGERPRRHAYRVLAQRAERARQLSIVAQKMRLNRLLLVSHCLHSPNTTPNTWP